MNWLSFVNGIVGILLIVVALSGLLTTRWGSIAVVIGGLIVMVLAVLRWITGFGRFSGLRPQALH